MLKYRLSIFQTNNSNSNIFQNALTMKNYNNNLKNSTLISKKEEKEEENIKANCTTKEERYLSLLNENKELKEIIKKYETKYSYKRK